MLSLDLATIIFQVINFLVLAFILNRFLFQPVLRKAAEREEEKNRLMHDLAEERRQLATVRADLEQKQVEFEEQLEQMRTGSRDAVEKERQELLKEARAEAEKILVEAQTDAYRLKEQAVNEFHEQLVEAILAVTSTVAGRLCPPEVHDRMVSGLGDRVREMGRSEMPRVEAIRRSLGNREAVAYVTTAKELSTDQQAQLVRFLTALADQNVDVQLKIDHDLVAGLRVRLGDTVMDNSLAGQLEELRGEVSLALKEQTDSA